jgi:phospho-N-acetylmuramoyl-pentapeptide-transferase
VFELIGEHFNGIWSGFNILTWITFRAAMAALTAFALGLVVGPRWVAWLRRQGVANEIRDREYFDLHERHRAKIGTPTMGGAFIVFSIVFSCLLWCRLSEGNVWLLLFLIVGFAALGAFDDIAKLRRQNTKGLSARQKLVCQFLIGGIVGLFLFFFPSSTFYQPMATVGSSLVSSDIASAPQVGPYSAAAQRLTMTPAQQRRIATGTTVPFFKTAWLSMGIFYIVFVMVVIVSTSNAVNLADGLDGLAIGCTILAALPFAIMCYLLGRTDMSAFLQLPLVPSGGELAVFCAALTGAAVAFLWFNSHPASVFMGDTGSLALGGALGAIAVLIKQELLLLVIGGVFVSEALSVVLQVASFKLTGRRIFLMAPIHHHFEKLGWHESKVIIRFWIVAGLLGVIGLAILKMR